MTDLRQLYRQPENHVLKRDGLPSALRPTLLESTRSDWKKHPRYSGKAQFFMTIHRDLITASANISSHLKELLDIPEANIREAVTHSGLLRYAGQFVSFAHHHHEIEDHGYFPHFIRLYPQLKPAMDLLDADHTALNSALEEAETGLRGLTVGKSFDKTAVAPLYKSAKALKRVLERHINDEEEVIIPIFLRHG